MRDVNHHIVARYTLELDFQDQSDARLVSEALLDASRVAVVDLIDACCSDLIGPETYVVIPQLEIDLGVLDMQHLTDDFLGKFRLALTQQLQAALVAQGDRSPVERALDLIVHYGDTGQYPWWAGSPAPALLEAAMDTLLQTRESHLHKVLRNHLQQGQMLRRLVFALPAAQLTLLWQCMKEIATPYLAQATMQAATWAVLQATGALGRTQWLEFTHKSLFQIIHGQHSHLERSQVIDWLLTEGEVPIAPSLLQRLRESDAFIALLGWMRDVLEVPAQILLPCLHDLGKPPVTGGMPQLRADGHGFQTWLRSVWKLPTAAVSQLMSGMVLIGFRHGPREQTSAKQAGEGNPILIATLPWLQATLSQPNAGLEVLLAKLAARFATENRQSEMTAAALDSWLRAVYTLAADAREALVHALLTQARSANAETRTQDERAYAQLLPWLQKALAMPEGRLEELIAALLNRYTQENPSAEATAAALDSWVRTSFALPAETRDILVKALAETAAIATPKSPTAAPSEEMKALLLPWLQKTLATPEGRLQDLIAALLDRYVQENPSAKVTVAALDSWVRTSFALPAEARDILVKALAETATSATPKSPKAAPSEEIQALLLPWLQKTLATPEGRLQDLVAALLDRYVQENPSAAATASALDSWVRTSFAMPAEARDILVKTLAETAAIATPKSPKIAPFEEMQALLLPWLQKTLDAPEGELQDLIAALLDRYFAENRSAPATAATLDSWLRTTYHLPTETRAALVQALVEAAEDTAARAGFAAQPELSLERLLPWLQRILDAPEGELQDLLLALLGRFNTENKPAEATSVALNSWLQTVHDLPADARDVLVAAMLQEPSQQAATRLKVDAQVLAPPTAKPNADLQALVPWLRHNLGMPHATESVLLVAMRIRFEEENPNAAGNAAAVENWLMDHYSLPAAARQLLVQALMATTAGDLHADSDPAQRHPALQFLVPWLRHTLGLKTADLPGLLDVLIGRFEGAQSARRGGIAEIDRWLRGNFVLAAESRVLLAQAMLVESQGSASAPAQPQLPTADPKEDKIFVDEAPVEDAKSHPSPEKQPEIATAAGEKETFGQNDWDVASPEAAVDQHPSFSQNPAQKDVLLPPPAAGDFGFEALLPWLRQTLGMPEATPAQLVTGLLASFRRENGPAMASADDLQAWLQRSLALSAGGCKTLAHALEAAMLAEDLTAKFSAARKPEPVAPARTAQPAELPSFVENAGLILFWPFLQRFLQHQGLVEDKAFVSPVAQEQAVRLLQWMVMPGADWNEASLTLPKLLCGLPPDALVDPQVPLTEEQIASDSTLIEVILAHWSMAGNMTADGFRQAWLLRNGTLRIRDDHWLLRVETMGHDLLLEGLPWDIAYIQLPWMPHVMYVDWGEKAKFNA